jgi:hypothetical protein
VVETGPPRIPGVERLQPIARGGHSVVYRGWQADLGRDVAVKVLTSSLEGGADDAQWRREITAMGRLSDHPNIVAAYTGGVTDDGRPYLVMPHLPEGSLGDRVRRSGPLPPAEVAALGAQLAGALAAAHDAGVLHRDVKPDNVMLSAYGQPQLTDFGIARLLDATTTMTRTIHATVAYAAPEVLLGQPATAAADVYGLGATLHACLAGAPPFPSTEHDNVVSLVSRITTQPPPDLRPLGVPDALASVIEHALAKRPTERIPDASELRRRLESAGAVLDQPRDHTPPLVPVGPLLTPRDEELAGIVPGALARERVPPPPQPDPRTHRPVRRRTAALVAAGVVGLLALVGLVALLARDDGGRAGDAGAGSGASEPTATSVETDVPAAEEGEAALASTAAAYFDAIEAGELDRSYAMLTPAFQAVQSRSSYEAFWTGVAPVDVVGPVDVDAGAATAVVPVTLGGRREDFPLRLARGSDGTWLIDGRRPGER